MYRIVLTRKYCKCQAVVFIYLNCTHKSFSKNIKKKGRTEHGCGDRFARHHVANPCTHAVVLYNTYILYKFESNNKSLRIMKKIPR